MFLAQPTKNKTIYLSEIIKIMSVEEKRFPSLVVRPLVRLKPGEASVKEGWSMQTG